MNLQLENQLSLARQRSERLIETSRTAALVRKQAAGSVQALVGGGMPGGAQRQMPTSAREQYLHNRGWVYACVRLVAQRVARQPIMVARDNPASRGFYSKAFRRALPTRLKGRVDRLEPLPSHPLLESLADPSDLHTTWTLLFSTVASLELTGRALWWVAEENGRRLILHIPTSWVVEVDARRTAWKIRPDGATQEWTLPGDEVAHFFYPDPGNPLGALSPLSCIAAAVVADEAISEAQRRSFVQGQMPGLILKAGRMPGANGSGPGQRPYLTAEQRGQLITAIRHAYSGVHNLGEPLILDAMIDEVTKLTFSPAELDFLSSSKLTKERICQGFGVNPVLMGQLEGANRASAVVAEEVFLANKVNPLCEMLSQAMTEWLGPIFAGPREKLVVWIQPAVVNDAELSLKQWSLALQHGAASRNEFRTAILGLTEKPGLDDYSSPQERAAARIALPGPPGADDDSALTKAATVDPYSLRRMNGKAAH